jgi:hypothetical protein
MTHTLDWVETLAGGPGGGLGISKMCMRFFVLSQAPLPATAGEGQRCKGLQALSIAGSEVREGIW